MSSVDTLPEPTDTIVTTAVVESPDLAVAGSSAYAGRPQILARVLQEETEQRRLLKQFVRDHMIDGVDYGKIPGTEKPTLLKPGAEKITDLFRCTPEFEILQRVEQWGDETPLFYYVFRCRIVTRDGGLIVAEGFGSANSREGRYRWRNADRLCPRCNKPTIIKGKVEYGGGWLCYAKKGGCGAKFGDHDRAITGQQVGKVPNDDPFALVNTVLKMAKKRAYVDAALSLARCSDIFTQDAEDLGNDYDSAPSPSLDLHAPTNEEPHFEAEAPTYDEPPPYMEFSATIDKDQQSELLKLFHQLHLAWHNDKARERLSILLGRNIGPNEPISNLTREEFPRVRDALREGLARRLAQSQKASAA